MNSLTTIPMLKNSNIKKDKDIQKDYYFATHYEQ